MTSRRILFYGSSLLLSLVTESLAQCPELQVSQTAIWAEASTVLLEDQPDVLIFDLTDSCESHVLPLLLKIPDLLLIGLDPETNDAVLLRGQRTQSLTLNQIKKIIQDKGSLLYPGVALNR